MKILYLSIIAISLLILVIPSVNAQNGTIPEENMTVSRHPAHVVYPTVNVTKFMSIAENSTEFKEKVNGYAHHSLATVILKPESENTGNTTMEYNLVYDLYKNPDEYCSYDKELVISLNVQLKVIDTTEYSPNDVPLGYPLPPMGCPMNYVPGKVDYNKLVSTIPWIPPLEQSNYGISAENVQCINGLTLVLKTEDGSPACVMPNTAQKLIERGWATNVSQSDPMANLANNTGIITLGNQTYYFETPNYTSDAYLHPTQISFHDVVFTLFPTGFRGGLPAIHCGLQGPGLGMYYWTDSKFSDNTHELLRLFAYSPTACNLPIPSMFSNHTNPRAGLVFYDGKMKLLVREENQTVVPIQSTHQPIYDTPYNPKETYLGPVSNGTSIGCSPNDFYLKIGSNSTAYLMGYNICDDNSCAKNNNLSLSLPINTVLNPNYQSIGLPVNLQWKYGDTVDIQLEVSSNTDNKTASLIDLGNSTIVH